MKQPKIHLRERARFTVFVFAMFAASAVHAFRWDVTEVPFTLSLGDNVSAEWSASLEDAVLDWSISPVVNLGIKRGSVKDPRNCRARNGKIEICSANYGNNNWLGLTTLTVTGDRIDAAIVRLNDTYFSMAPYNDVAWRNMVMCHELGHVLGIQHVDENFSNESTASCMDYSIDPTFSQSPNNADYIALEALYADIPDGTSTDGGGGGTKPCRGKKCASAFSLPQDEPANWGQLVSRKAGHERFELDLGDGRRQITLIRRPF
jgi:hypothetical protein